MSIFNKELSTKTVIIVLGSIVVIPFLILIMGYILPVWYVSVKNEKIISQITTTDSGLDPAYLRLCLRDSVKLSMDVPTILPLHFEYSRPVSNSELLPVIVTDYERYERTRPNKIVVYYNSYSYFMIPVGEGEYECQLMG